MSNENKIVGAICLVFFIIIVFLFWKGVGLNEPTQVKNQTLLVREKSHMTGKNKAKVTIVEFGDYQCPACANLHTEMKKIVELYKNNPDFNFVFRNFPLSQHKNAVPAAEAAEAAGAQNRYFEMEAILYENQTRWSENSDPIPEFLKYAADLKLDIAQFTQDLTSHKFVATIQADALDGQTLSVDHTPTLYINGIEQRDLSFEGIKNRIDQLLKI